MRRAYGTDELLQRASGLAHRKVVNSGDIPIVFSAILAISSGSDAARREPFGPMVSSCWMEQLYGGNSHGPSTTGEPRVDCRLYELWLDGVDALPRLQLG